MNELQKQAIEHYDRMINFVKANKDTCQQFIQKDSDASYPKYNRFFADYMEQVLGEDFYSDYCSYCDFYQDVCNDCPLGKKTGSVECCNGLWAKLLYIKTTDEFIQIAKNIKKYIKENG